MTRVSAAMEREILGRPEVQKLINELGEQLDQRRRKYPSEDRSASLNLTLNSSEEYRNGSQEFRRVVSAEVQGRGAEIIAERLRKRGRLPKVYPDWQHRWENEKDERLAS